MVFWRGFGLILSLVYAYIERKKRGTESGRRRRETERKREEKCELSIEFDK